MSNPKQIEDFSQLPSKTPYKELLDSEKKTINSLAGTRTVVDPWARLWTEYESIWARLLHDDETAQGLAGLTAWATLSTYLPPQILKAPKNTSPLQIAATTSSSLLFNFILTKKYGYSGYKAWRDSIKQRCENLAKEFSKESDGSKTSKAKAIALLASDIASFVMAAIAGWMYTAGPLVLEPYVDGKIKTLVNLYAWSCLAMYLPEHLKGAQCFMDDTVKLVIHTTDYVTTKISSSAFEKQAIRQRQTDMQKSVSDFLRTLKLEFETNPVTRKLLPELTKAFSDDESFTDKLEALFNLDSKDLISDSQLRDFMSVVNKALLTPALKTTTLTIMSLCLTGYFVGAFGMNVLLGIITIIINVYLAMGGAFAISTGLGDYFVKFILNAIRGKLTKPFEHMSHQWMSNILMLLALGTVGGSAILSTAGGVNLNTTFAEPYMVSEKLKTMLYGMTVSGLTLFNVFPSLNALVTANLEEIEKMVDDFLQCPDISGSIREFIIHVIKPFLHFAMDVKRFCQAGDWSGVYKVPYNFIGNTLISAYRIGDQVASIPLWFISLPVAVSFKLGIPVVKYLKDSCQDEKTKQQDQERHDDFRKNLDLLDGLIKEVDSIPAHVVCEAVAESLSVRNSEVTTLLEKAVADGYFDQFKEPIKPTHQDIEQQDAPDKKTHDLTIIQVKAEKLKDEKPTCSFDEVSTRRDDRYGYATFKAAATTWAPLVIGTITQTTVEGVQVSNLTSAATHLMCALYEGGKQMVQGTGLTSGFGTIFAGIQTTVKSLLPAGVGMAAEYVSNEILSGLTVDEVTRQQFSQGANVIAMTLTSQLTK